MVLFIFALGLYELFIGKLNVPPWLNIVYMLQAFNSAGQMVSQALTLVVQP
jgi:uncharacterized membrane protein YqhA